MLSKKELAASMRPLKAKRRGRMGEPKSQTKRREIIVRLLGAYYREYDPPADDVPACACLGIDCQVLGCDLFWDSFFGTFSADDVRRMIQSYLVVRRA